MPPQVRGESSEAPRRPKIGLALGAGVARGWAHIGVLRALERYGIVPDIVVGTSIGAVVGGAYVSDSLDVLEDWARSLRRASFFRYLDFRIRSGGLFGGTRLNQLMEENFGAMSIEGLPRPFTAVSCELTTGHEVWLNHGPLPHAIQASFALPGVFEPVVWEGRWLVDGALVNPVPVSVCRAMGAELVIAVNLAEDLYGLARGRRAGELANGSASMLPDIEAAASNGRNGKRAIMRQIFSNENGMPSLFSNMLASLNIIQNRLSRSRLAGEPPDVSIVPRCGHVGLMEFHRADELINEGERAFDAARPQLQDALAVMGYAPRSHDDEHSLAPGV